MPIPVIAAGLVNVGDCDGSSGESARAPARVSRELGQPEVEHLHGAVVSHFDVGRLQIAMDDALLVRRFERFGDLPGDRQRFVDRDRSVRNAIGEGRSLDELHDERLHAVRVFEPVDGRDVWMIQRGEDFGFALEARQPVGIGGERPPGGS